MEEGEKRGRIGDRVEGEVIVVLVKREEEEVGRVVEEMIGRGIEVEGTRRGFEEMD